MPKFRGDNFRRCHAWLSNRENCVSFVYPQIPFPLIFLAVYIPYKYSKRAEILETLSPQYLILHYK